jgi:hypothetical protein
MSTIGILLTACYSTRLIVLPMVRRKLSLSLPFFIIRAIQSNKLVEIGMVAAVFVAGVIGRLTSEAFVAHGSDCFYDSLPLTEALYPTEGSQVTSFILLPFGVLASGVITGSPFYRKLYKPFLLRTNKVT